MRYIFANLLFTLAFLPMAGLAMDQPASPAGAKILSRYDSAVINWQNPDRLDHAGSILFRCYFPVGSYWTIEAVNGPCDKIYEGLGNTYTDKQLSPVLPYYYVLFAEYANKHYSKAVTLEKAIVEKEKEEETEAVVVETIETLTGSPAEQVNRVARTEAGMVYGYNGQIETGENARRLSLFIIVKSPHELSDQDKTAISYFIHSGTPTTLILGSGERAGVLNSYLSVFNKLPRNELEWQDVIKIGNGRWPEERSPESEERAAEEFFGRIWQRDPDMNSPFDNAAVTVIAYGLRPGQRNMESEKKAIKIYRDIFGQAPAEAHEWDIVRAIAYSGATR